MSAPLEPPAKPSRFPDALVLIFAMIVLAQVATYFLPSGEFARETEWTESAAEETVLLPLPEGLEEAERERVVLPAGTSREEATRKVKPGTYAHVEAEPLPWHASLSKILAGMEAAADIIFFVFLVGGVIAVIKATGAIDALITACIERLGGRPILLVGGMTTLFAVGSSTIGMAEEYMPFIPVLVAMCIALKMDAVVAMGIVYIGAGVGYGCAAMNPFTVMIAKTIAGQEFETGLVVRLGLFVVMLATGVHHALRYARRIQLDPKNSLVSDIDYSSVKEKLQPCPLTRTRTVILLAFAAMIGIFVWGVVQHGWYLVELSALFLGVGLVSAALGGLSPNRVAREFTTGAAELAGTALLIGFARTIEVVLTNAQVIDTVIHGIASTLEHAEGLGNAAAPISAWGMLGVQSVCNFLIPSGSGQAYVTMPIMAPLADLTGVGRETSVLAYQLGDGLMNMVVPTNALLMGMLFLAKVPFQRWLRFIVPLMLKLYVVALVVLAWAASTKLQ